MGSQKFSNRYLSLDLDYLNSMRESGTLCDIILIVEGVQFPAHKVVLAACSPYFQAMFTSSFKEKYMSRQEIHGISSEAFSILLSFIYNGKDLVIKDDNVESLLEASSFLQLDHVKALCSVHLKSMISSHNFLEIRDIATRYDSKEVTQACDKFISFNFHKIVTSPSFLSLSEENVATIISNDLPDVHKQIVVEGVEKWVNHEPSRGNSLMNLKEKIRQNDDNCILACSSEMIGDSQTIKVKFYDVERGTWFTLTETTILKDDQIKALVFKDGKLFLVHNEFDEDGSIGEFDIDEYDIQSRCWNKSSQKLRYFDPFFDVFLKVDIDSDIENINLHLDLISTISKSITHPQLIQHGGKYYHEGEERSIQVFDPILKKFKRMTSWGIQRDLVRFESLGKYLYVLGGENYDDGGAVRSVEAFDPEANSWITVADMNEARARFWSVTYNGLLYVMGGTRREKGKGLHVSSFECFNPTTNKWTILKSMDFSTLVDFAEVYVVAEDGWIIVRIDLNRRNLLYKYNIDRGTWLFEEVEENMKTNFCVVRKQVILPFSSDETRDGEKDSLVERYFDELAQQI